MSELINEWLSAPANIIQIITFIPILWTFHSFVWGKKSRHKKWFAEARENTGQRPSVLIVDLLIGKDVRAQVEHFLASDEKLKSIPKERIFNIKHTDKLIVDNMPALHREIIEVASEIIHAGTDVLHVFMAGPVSAAAMVGAEFSNAGCQVNLYQNENGKYVNFGPLKHWN